jgi:nucleotide-binding universal stress UspA family protein
LGPLALPGVGGADDNVAGSIPRVQEDTMISTIVVPLDGTARAERALTPARELAECLGASVLLFRAAGDDAGEASAYLDEQARLLADVPVTTVVHQGFESSGLADHVRNIPHAAVCMTSDIASYYDAVIGQIAEDVIDAGTAPVLLVGPACTGRTAGQQAVVCADGSAAGSSIEPVVAEWANALDLPVHLLTVLHPERRDLAGVPVERILREVHSLAFRLERHGLTVSTEILGDGTDPAHIINRYIEDHPAALVATSTRGHRHDLHPVLGATVRHLVRVATVPVLVARPAPATYHG